MNEATKLTRSGKLLEATALIQKLLSKNHSATLQNPASPLWQPLKLPSRKLPVTTPVDGLQPAVALRRSIAGTETNVAPGQFISKSYTCTFGQRDYKLFIPSSYAGFPLPLIVMLHGCTQSPDDFAAGTQMNILAEEMGFLVAYPAQSSSASSMGCWNWFKTSDQQKNSGEPALIAGITRQIMMDYAVDRQKVYVAGLSAGGAMAAVLGITHPDLFAAIGVHSGLPRGAATDMASAFSAMKRKEHRSPISSALHPVPTIVFHGDKDRTVHFGNSHDVIAQFDPASAFERSETTAGRSSGAMNYSHSVLRNEHGVALLEQWLIHGAGHAWSGGSAKGSYTEPRGPDASQEMVRFFLAHSLAN